MDMKAYRLVLEEKRRALLHRLGLIDSDLSQSRSADWEEQAVEAENDEVLEGLGKSGLSELNGIDAAILRIKQGQFGKCTICGGDIGEDRLHVLPETPFCKRCAEDVQHKH